MHTILWSGNFSDTDVQRKAMLKWILFNTIWKCGLEWACSRLDPVASFWQHGNYSHGSLNARNTLAILWTTTLQGIRCNRFSYKLSLILPVVLKDYLSIRHHCCLILKKQSIPSFLNKLIRPRHDILDMRACAVLHVVFAAIFCFEIA
jgi:hypothetical protein